MNEAEQMESLADLVGQLVDESDPRAQERALVASLYDGQWAQAVALWRRGRDRRWIQVIAQGPDDLLPRRSQVEGIWDGDLPPELPLGKRVFFAKRNGGVLALAVGGIAGDLEIEDLLEAMFRAFVTITGDDTGSPAPIAMDGPDLAHESDWLDLLQGPAPKKSDPDREGPWPWESR
jgi:hypothetical protein